MTQASSYLPADFYEEGIAADSCLLATRCDRAPLSMLEHAASARRMNASHEVYPRLSLRTMLEPKKGQAHELLWARHARDVVFRRENGARTQFTLQFGPEGLRVVVLGKNRTGNVQVLQREAAQSVSGTRLSNPERAFVRLDEVGVAELRAEFARYGFQQSQEQLLALSFEARIAPTEALTAELDYDPLLGACEKVIQ